MSQTSSEQIEHVSEAYAEVSSQLGLERLRLDQMIDREKYPLTYTTDAKARQQQEWRVERLTRATSHLFDALKGTPRERISAEGWAEALAAAHFDSDGAE